MHICINYHLTTKENILEHALILFNEKGVREVTTRMISQKTGISQGNLTYHFTKKEDIIFALYLNLVKEIDFIFSSSSQQSSITVKQMYGGTLAIYEAQLKYRFCMIDFVQLMRDIPRINQHFKSLMEFRKIQFFQLFQTAIKSNVLNPEEFPGQYALLSIPMGVLGDYWLSHAEILFEGNDENVCETYAKSAMMLFYPFLTDSAKSDLMKIIKP
jgi:AcrR family transcriptional regulator